MGRPNRVFLPDTPLHVIQRGHSRQSIFFTSLDYRLYLEWLREAAAKYRLAVHGYALMTNHVHLLTTPADAKSLSLTLQSLNRRYVRYINDREGRSGTLWEGRCRAVPVDSEAYFLTCLRYIELNPVRAGLVVEAAMYPWSSFRHHALGHPDALVNTHAVYRSLGATPRRRQRAYADLVRDALSRDTLNLIRSATDARRPLGGPAFASRVRVGL